MEYVSVPVKKVFSPLWSKWSNVINLPPSKLFGLIEELYQIKDSVSISDAGGWGIHQ